MAEIRRGEEAKNGPETSPADYDATVVAPRFDEREAATARPVVPLSGRQGFSRRVNSKHLLLAWAVVATLAAVAFAVYRNTQTAEAQQVTPQPAQESTASGVPSASPRPVRREAPVAPVKATRLTEARDARPSSEVPDWSGSEYVTPRDEKDDEELAERARKEEKRRRKEEKERREEAEEEAKDALKEARKRAERLREKLKDEGGKARLIGVIARGSGM